MTTKTEEVSAVRLAEDFAADIRNAQLASAKVTAAIVAADAEISDAQAARRESMDAVVLQRAGAEEQLRASTIRLAQAHAQRSDLDAQAESAMRVLRTTQERLRALRIDCLPEFRAEAEEIVSEVELAAVALVEPLRAYLESWGRAESIWRPLGPGVRAKVEADDAEKGYYRSGESLDRDLRLPSCPIPADVVRLIGTVLPRPRAMEPNYNGDPFQPLAASSDDVMPELVGPDGPLIFGNSE